MMLTNCENCSSARGVTAGLTREARALPRATIWFRDSTGQPKKQPRKNQNLKENNLQVKECRKKKNP